MARSSKGIITKQNILQTAKELFYHQGFSDTKVTEICSKANVKLGTFTYYFSTKEALVSEIYAEYLVKVYTYATYFENRKMNSLEMNVIATFLYYRIIFDDHKNTRFHYEVLLNLSIYSFLSNSLKRIYSRFVHDLNLDIDEKELARISAADLGVRRELTLEYIENKMFSSSLDLVTTIYIMMGRLFKIDSKIMDDYITKAIESLEKNDFSKIKFLV